MKDFQAYLSETGEIGIVAQIVHSIVYVEGLPQARVYELVVFENGEMGQVLALSLENVEVLLMTTNNIKVGTRVARTNQYLQIALGEDLLGKAIDPIGRKLGTKRQAIKSIEHRPVDSQPMGLLGRKDVSEPFETGVKMVDLTVPMGKGQRQLVIGDRKTGKSVFLNQIIEHQAKRGTVCVYAAIGKKQIDIKRFIDFVNSRKIVKQSIVVASGSADPSGMIFLTPYTAMTVAEYFRDKGHDVLLVLDDLSTHAKYYREITLLARRFPGRSSYPGDIFYIHARLMERAGNFTRGSITCLPVAESIAGDLSGYIQTNLMSMTDGHLFFNSDRFNDGARPALDPFLSVTRVGLQAQTPLVRDLHRQLTSFLVQLEGTKDLMHFGAEVSDNVRASLKVGEIINTFFNQDSHRIVPLNISIVLMAAVWAGTWKSFELEPLKKEFDKKINLYSQDDSFKKLVDSEIARHESFGKLVADVGKLGFSV